MAKYLPLGAAVIVNADLFPSKTRKPNKYGKDVPTRRWIRFEYEKPVSGIVAGVRTIYEGQTREDWEEGLRFIPSKSITVYLVAVNLRSIIHALPEDVFEVATEEATS